MNDKDVTKSCGICGDRAHGYNFNAITCESCKAFFRRNALRKKDFKCPFDGICKIDSITRKFCKKCRLKKCFENGMKKEWILSDEERINLRNKIAENRRKRKTVHKSQSKVADSTTSSYQFPNVVHLIQNSYTVSNDKSFSTCSSNIAKDMYMNLNEITSSSVSEAKQYLDLSQSTSTSNASAIPVQNIDIYNQSCDSLVKSNSTDNEYKNCFEFQSVIKSQMFAKDIDLNTSQSSKVQLNNKCSVITSSIENIKNNCIDNIDSFDVNTDKSKKSVKNDNKGDNIPDNVYQRAVELEFASIPIKELYTESKSDEFNRYETEKLKELSIAATFLSHRIGQNGDNIKITSEFSDIIDTTKMLAHKCDQAIRKLVIMSKKISAFKDLCQHDQIALMKAGCFEILIMRSAVSYNNEQEYWVLMDHDNAAMLKLEVFKQAKGDLYEAHRKFMQSFKDEWDNDLDVLNLLTAIVLLTPDRPNIIHKEIIKLEQQTYMYLLQRYLISKYKSKCEAKLKFLKYMSKLEELHILHDQHIRIYLEVDPQDVGPLLLEILDLNPYNTLRILE